MSFLPIAMGWLYWLVLWETYRGILLHWEQFQLGARLWMEQIFVDHNNQPHRHNNNPPQDDQEKPYIKPMLISLL
jgi:hypothetical protein